MRAHWLFLLCVLAPVAAWADPPFAERGTHGVDPDPANVECSDTSGTIGQPLLDPEASLPLSPGDGAALWGMLAAGTALGVGRRRRPGI